MAQINLHKGHDLHIAGRPKKEVISGPDPGTVALLPDTFRSVKPKLMVQEGDRVKIGTPLFFDKVKPSIKWGSPGAGTIKEIRFGERRSLQRIVIDLDSEEASIAGTVFRSHELSGLDRNTVKDTILQGNLWPIIRQRPFNKVSNPQDDPKAIFISGWNSAPLTADLDLVLQGQQVLFQAGLDVLSCLTSGPVHLSFNADSVSETLHAARNVEIHTISGPHPAGNVGIHIHHLDPLNHGEIIWTVAAQQVITLGKFFLTGTIDPFLVVSVGGPGIKNPIHMKSRLGAPMATLLNEQLGSDPVRIISGDVLTGRKTDQDGYLDFYESTVSVIPETEKREFLGWLKPGSAKTRYSLIPSYFSIRKKPFSFTTARNGGVRGPVPINAWEDVLPMDIIPTALYRSILACDIEEMEGLGILECDEEDFALCTFACPSKIELSSIIRDGLDLMEKEG